MLRWSSRGALHSMVSSFSTTIRLPESAGKPRRVSSISTKRIGSGVSTVSISPGAFVVDERRLRRVLQRVSDDLGYLRERARQDREAIRKDVDRLAALKYHFVTAIEGCLDAAQHLCASEGWGPPSSNADALRILGRHGVLPQDLAESLAHAVGFRNVLVHGYADVDDDRVVAQLDRVSELEAFVQSVSRWLGDGA